jgi:predicted amidohydrolase
LKGAAVVFNEADFSEAGTYKKLLEKIHQWLDSCEENSVDVIVFPALLGCLYGDGQRYMDDILRVSLKHKGISICPGSYYEKDTDGTYHSSCLIAGGCVILRQRQIYLAKWEKSLGLSRGTGLNYVYIGDLKTAIMVSTDLFYPQVSRMAAMSGAELVLAPAAVKSGRNLSRQLSGLWQNVQQNLFFGVESGFKGYFAGSDFYSRSIIHGPLELTEKENGFLALEDSADKNYLITSEFDNEKRKQAVKKFNTLAQLNIELYKDSPFFG